MTDIEETVRRIVETNRKSRAGFDALSARLVSVISEGNWGELDDILDELAPGSGEVPEGEGEDSQLGGGASDAESASEE